MSSWTPGRGYWNYANHVRSESCPEGAMSKEKKGGEDGSGGECNNERGSGRRRGGRDEPSGKEGGREEIRRRVRRGRAYYRREKERVHAPMCVCIHAEGDSPHCDCYTHGRNVPPVCRLMPTRNQTRADSSYCSLSSQQRSNRLHNLPPALLFAARHTCRTYTHDAHGRIYSLYERSTKEEKEREKRKTRERWEGELNHE